MRYHASTKKVLGKAGNQAENFEGQVELVLQIPTTMLQASK